MELTLKAEIEESEAKIKELMLKQSVLAQQVEKLQIIQVSSKSQKQQDAELRKTMTDVIKYFKVGMKDQSSSHEGVIDTESIISNSPIRVPNAMVSNAQSKS